MKTNDRPSIKPLTTALMLLVLIFAFNQAKSQDIIIKKNTEEIKCKVIEIEDLKVKYKNWDNVDGPIYSISKSEIFMIKYENGNKETFENKKGENKDLKVKSNDNQKEIFGYKHMIRLGTSSYNPFINNFKNLGTLEGGGGSILLQGSSFINKNKTLSVTSTFLYLWSYASSIDDGWGYYYDASYSGYGLICKLDAHWLKTKTGSFYSGLGIGYLIGNVNVTDYYYSSSVDNIVGLSWQVDLIGIQASFAKHIGMFTEIGYGHEGVFQIGLQFHY